MNDFFYSVIASCFSAYFTKTTVAPLERIKLLKQSQPYYNTNNYNSIFNSFRYIYKNEGLLGFYRGNLSNIARIGPAYMVKFPANEFYQKHIPGDKKSYQYLLTCGVLAGLTQITITYPLDTLRTRMTLDLNMTKNYNSLYNCFKTIYKNEGLLGFYKGFGITGSTYPFYVGIQFSIYRYLKEDYGYFGAPVAGFIAQTSMYPGDTIKRQMQINGLDNTKQKYRNLFHCVKSIYKNKGIRGFYPGLSINLIKSIPEATLQFVIYENVLLCIKNNI